MAGQGEGSVKASFYALGANAEIAVAQGAAVLWTSFGVTLAEGHCATLPAQLGCPKLIRYC